MECKLALTSRNRTIFIAALTYLCLCPLLPETPEALSQTDNSERMAAAGGGISLFRTRDGYPSGELLPEPELVTTDTWEQYGHDFYGVSDSTICADSHEMHK